MKGRVWLQSELTPGKTEILLDHRAERHSERSPSGLPGFGQCEREMKAIRRLIHAYR